MVISGLLALFCYGTGLVGDLATDAAPALHRHANTFTAVGGLFLLIELWLGWRIRKAKAAPHL